MKPVEQIVADAHPAKNGAPIGTTGVPSHVPLTALLFPVGQSRFGTRRKFSRELVCRPRQGWLSCASVFVA
jgi:hypothetical protein